MEQAFENASPGVHLAHGSHAPRGRGTTLTRVYLCLLVFTLPMDWFRPTGYLFREGGARPAIPLMIAGSLYLLFSRWKNLAHALPESSSYTLSIFCGIVFCGFTAFMLNLIFGWSRFGEAKNPLTQFITQTLLLLIVPLIIVTHAELLAERQWCSYVMKVLPWAAFVHPSIVVLNALQLLDFTSLPLSLFRNTETSTRVAGLMSEPSYLGTMAAMYGLPR